MTCPTCSGPLAALFTSTYCPVCEAKASASAPKVESSPLPVGTLFVTGSFSPVMECAMFSWDGKQWVTVGPQPTAFESPREYMASRGWTVTWEDE